MADMIEVRDAAARLHDEAHGDDKMPFRSCQRQTCRDLSQALDEHWCED